MCMDIKTPPPVVSITVLRPCTSMNINGDSASDKPARSLVVCIIQDVASNGPAFWLAMVDTTSIALA